MPSEQVKLDRLVEVDPYSGDFYVGTPSTFLRNLEKAFKEGGTSGNYNVGVPCGSCNICCRSGYNIYLDKNETESFPEAVFDEAEGRPMLPFARDGKTCSKLIDGKCSIYSYRPRVCRSFDCRGMFFVSISPAPGQHKQELSDLITHRMYTALKTKQDKMVMRILQNTGQFLIGSMYTMSHSDIAKMAGTSVDVVGYALQSPETAAMLAIRISVQNYSMFEKLVDAMDNMPTEAQEELASLFAKQGLVPKHLTQHPAYQDFLQDKNSKSDD